MNGSRLPGYRSSSVPGYIREPGEPHMCRFNEVPRRANEPNADIRIPRCPGDHITSHELDMFMHPHPGRISRNPHKQPYSPGGRLTRERHTNIQEGTQRQILAATSCALEGDNRTKEGDRK